MGAVLSVWLCVALGAVTNVTDMALVPGGAFIMGDTRGIGRMDERPAHRVYVGTFLIDRAAVSNAQVADVFQWAFEQGKVRVPEGVVVNAEGQRRKLLDLQSGGGDIRFEDAGFSVAPGREQSPCVGITWYGALAYCAFRSEREGLPPGVHFRDWSCDFARGGYRLPTEAEWEKAARGGSEGQSVWEWCWDRYDPAWYGAAASRVRNPTGPAEGRERVKRGGPSHGAAPDQAVDAPAAARRRSRRASEAPEGGAPDLGFRCVRRPGFAP